MTGSANNPATATLILPAAGSGSRFGTTTPKQLLPLAGRTVLLRSLDAFRGLVADVVIPVAAAWRNAIEGLLAAESWPFSWRVVEGGATRQDSVHAGLCASDPDLPYILIHDAARPLVPRQIINSCLLALNEAPAALVAIPCSSTVKHSRDGLHIAATIPRAPLWLAQTPQGLRRAEALAAFAQAQAEGWQCSDDVEIMERAGHQVRLVMGDACNLKLTTSDDLRLAEALLATRGKG